MGVPLLLGMGIIGLLIGVIGYVFIRSITKGGSGPQMPHPSELTSESRAIIRPLRQAVESFEAVLKSNSNQESAKILGPNALESVRNTLREATKMMPNRDVLVEMARRTESQGNDPSAPNDAIDRIDRNIAEATSAIDALTLKITASIGTEKQEFLEMETDLPDLVKRLQSVSQSFDEVNQSLNQEN
ncbi:MAG: hypothetical protein ACKVQS_09285 [Fimbriimonadaceae bacterium]